MEWTQFIIMFLGMLGLFAWNRAEARNDARQAQSIISAIKDEIKDFHGRLCALEEKHRQKKEK